MDQSISALPSGANASTVASAFARDGFVVVRGLCDEQIRGEIGQQVVRQLDPLVGPAEFEADVGYPGAPASKNARGGTTPRRLLNAYGRFPALRELALSPQVGAYLELLGLGARPQLSQCHHNCVMTKHPGYSSATLWHQDIRYWSFDRPELISVWVALGKEQAINGSLQVIPGSHLLELDRGRLDRDLFLRPELDENKGLIRSHVSVDLNPGDVLFFHCRVFHAAGKNRTETVKLSPVFTYHAVDNLPIPDTRSAQYPSIGVAR